MLLRWVVRAVNALIAVALLTALGAAWWFAWRPMPQTSGTVRLPVAGKATVVRDERGVPHVRAGSVEDAAFLHGYVTAQDRMWQMDAIRRLAAGELSEVLGPSLLETDMESRRLLLRRAAQDQLSGLQAEDRKWLALYAAGVNCYLEGQRSNLPLEFRLLDYEPRPWTVVDSMLVALHMYRTLTTSWRDEVTRARMMEGGDPQKVNLLFPARTGADLQPGSNAWAISGRHTVSGRPLLANDPHLEFSFPSTWHLVHLEAPGLNVAGAALPGLPFVIIGHNEHIAWGVTNLHYDVQDLYSERFDPASGRYLFRGQVEQARLEREVIAVRGRKPAELPVWVTRHGPIILSAGGRHFALKWMAHAPDGFQYPMAQLNRARNWEEFRAALSRFPGPAQNFVYADTQGNIGYQGAGVLPVREGFNGELPLDGASGQSEWERRIPFEDMPSIFNPPSGRIVTANQNPFPRDYRHPVAGNFAAPYRFRQIRDLLSQPGRKWKAEDMLAVQKDVYSPFLHFLARQIAAAHKDTTGPRELQMLAAWDGQMEKGTAAPFLATLAYQHVRKAVAESASPGKGQSYEYQMASAVIESLLRERPAGWVADWDKMLTGAFADAADEARRIQGVNPNKWDWGRWNQADISHPVVSRIPWIGPRFSIGRVPMSGASTTVKQTTRRLGPSMRFVADAGDWDRSLLNVTIGESGHPLSPHYKDQWEAYYSGRSFPLPFSNVPAKSTLTIEPGDGGR
ncbi:MAG: penicillin acylase family protein [Bryobacteraceae bacterium]|nr:penicillin acylase family protein [Bryobacteraceae bacterium]